MKFSVAATLSDTKPDLKMERWRARAGWRIIAHKPESFSYTPVQRQMVRITENSHNHRTAVKVTNTLSRREINPCAFRLVLLQIASFFQVSLAHASCLISWMKLIAFHTSITGNELAVVAGDEEIATNNDNCSISAVMWTDLLELWRLDGVCMAIRHFLESVFNPQDW